MDALHDRWFVFDAGLVLLTVWEVWILPILFDVIFDVHSGGILRFIRIVRVARLSRVARMMKEVPAIAIFMKGLARGMATVCVSFSILCVFNFVFSVLFTQLLRETKIGTG